MKTNLDFASYLSEDAEDNQRQMLLGMWEGTSLFIHSREGYRLVQPLWKSML